MFNYAIRVTLPFADVSGIVTKWADRSSKCVAFQHDADQAVKKTHIHIALFGVDVKEEALKRMWKDCPGKGNEFWSWKHLDDIDTEWCDVEINKPQSEQNKSQLIVELKYLIYMAKGKLREKFVKNISPAILECSRKLWVEPVLGNDKASADHSEKIIGKIMSHFNIKNERGIYRRPDDVLDYGQCKYNLELLLTNVRSVAFRQLWGEHRRVPHASHYKIIASTAFLRICEDAGCFEQGAGLIQNLWY